MGDELGGGSGVSRARKFSRALLWTLGAAFTAAATAYTGWLLMAVASLYAGGSPVEASRFESKSKSERSHVAELAAALAPYSSPALAPPPTSDEFGKLHLHLTRTEVSEIQQRLKGLGFDPGRVDGAAGKRTEEAARRYRENRSLAEIGVIDRQLLNALRADPVPLLPPAETPTAGSAPARHSNPVLASIRVVSDRLGRWLNSI
jgi:hypothetical protein